MAKPPKIKPGSFDDAMGSLLRGPGEGATESLSYLQKFGRRAAPLADDLVVMAPALGNTLPDGSDAQKAHELRGHLQPNRLSRDAGHQAERDTLQNGWTPEQGIKPEVPGVRPQAQPVKHKAEGAEAFFEAVEPAAAIAETGLGIVGLGQFAIDAILPGIGTVAGKMGYTGAEKKLNAPYNYLNPKEQMDQGQRTLGRNLNDGVMAAFTAKQGYDVAKGVFENLASLHSMSEAMTGKKLSTMALLTGKDAPEMVKEARSHFIKEYGSRSGVMAIAGVLMARGIRSKHGIGLLDFGLPMVANMGIDTFMGNSTLPTFKGLNDAFNSGAQLKQEDYSTFVLAASKDLKSRGVVGKQVSWQVAGQYLAEHTSPGQILLEIEESQKAHLTGDKGKFDVRIGDILAKAEAAQAAKRAAKKEKHAPAQVELKDAAAPQVSMVERINGQKQPQQPVMGDFTKKVAEQRQGMVPQLS